MVRTANGVRLGIACLILLIACSGATSAANSASLTADPMGAGELSTHTLTVTVDRSSAGGWSGLQIDYGDSGANPAQTTMAGIQTIGIDRGDDDAGTTTDVDVSGDLEDVSGRNTGELTIRLGGGHSVEAGDEIVLRVSRSIQNPASDGDYELPIDVNPSAPGGETTAKLQIGSERATVLADDQSTTGDAVTVDAVTLPSGGFVVVHEKTALGNGAQNVEAVTGQSVVGVSEYRSAGSYEDVTVALDAELQSEGRYVAMATKDGDGDETFDADTDRPYTIGGNPIWEAASYTVREPTETPTDTATPSPVPETETATPTDIPETTTPTPTPASSPGFGVSLVIVTLLGIGLAAGRHWNH